MREAVPYAVTVAFLIGLAVPPAIVQRSWARFFIAVPLILAGVAIPLFVFAFSSFLVPEWKGGCKYGWLDCFHLGKLALTPLVLWATAALYAVDVCRVPSQNRWWIGMGFFLGAIVSALCLIFGWIVNGRDSGNLPFFLLVPLYIAVWHSVRAVRSFKAGTLQFPDGLKGLVGSAPFWAVGVIWSKSTYQSLPNVAPSCFVVTAAMRGHKRLVGPFVKIRRGGSVCVANQQLITLWQFEALWYAYAPLSHSVFRRIYNRFGPRLAEKIRSPWTADLAYAVLIPVQLLAMATIKIAAILDLTGSATIFNS